MKKLIPFLVSSILLVGTFGCEQASKTGSETPSTTNEASQPGATPASQTYPTSKLPEPPITSSAPSTDTKVKTDSPKTTATTKAKSDLKAEVSEKLNKGLPGNKLEVENQEGEIILKGKATSVEELKKAETLAKEVPGVKTVKVEAKVEGVKKP